MADKSNLKEPTLGNLTNLELKDEYANAGRNFNFDPKGVDRYLTYGSKTYGELGYNPFRDNEAKYQQETHWTKDISRGFNGMVKLAGVGLSDSFAFGAFGNEDNHKDFGKIMQDYGSQRGGSVGFWSNTMLSAGYTVGILASVAAEEMLLAGATFLSGGLAAPATGTLMAAEAARAGSLLGKAGKFLAKADNLYLNKTGVLGSLRNIDNARWYHNGIHSFGKAINPVGSSADFLRMFKPQNLQHADMLETAARFKELNGLTKTVMGAGALARDARKFYLAHSESDLEAKFVRDEIIDEAKSEWYKTHPGQSMPEEVRKHIEGKGLEGYKKTYETNFGLIYLTNAIAFDGLFKGFSPTNKLLKTIGDYRTTGKGLADITVDVMAPSIKNYVLKQASGVTWHGMLGGAVRGSMEGVQEVGQDIISSAAKKYAGVKFDSQNNVIVDGSADDMSRGAYWNQVANSLGDSSWETFASGALMGIFASPVNFATKVVNEYSFGEKGFGSEYNQWTEEGRKKYKALWEERKDNAKILTEFFRTQGASFEADVNGPAHRMIGLREQMLQAAKEGNKKIFEEKKQAIFQLSTKLLFKTGLHTELIDHLDQMTGYSAKELNESLDRVDITEENKAEYLDKIKKRKEDILSLKKEYDQIERDMGSKGSVDRVLRDGTLTPEEKQERVLDILTWDNLKEEMLFNGDNLRNIAERKKAILNKVKGDTRLTDLDLAALTNREDLQEQINILSEQVKSNEEYKLDNTKEHRQAKLKLQALQELQKGFSQLDDPKYDKKNESAVKSVYDSMEKAFAKYVIAADSQYTQISDAVLNATISKIQRTKQFVDLFDFYQLDEESKELEYYGDILNNPESASKWMKANRDLLVSLGKNKRQYIEDTIEAWQTREVSDEMMNDLLEMGIIFPLDQLDDIFKKGVMPTKLYDANTREELSPERYKQAIKIIEKYQKKLTGKKIVGTKQGFRKGRTKVKSDKRRASQLVNDYAGRNKLNTPIELTEFINKLLAKGNKYLTLAEIELLEKLKGLTFDNKVVLTDNSNAPISFDNEGNLVIDVRFGAQDYMANNVPFETIAIAGIIQNIFKSRIEGNESLAEDISSIMNEAKQAHIARIADEIQDPKELRLAIAQVSSLDIFTDPLAFLTEAFANKDFQEYLASVKSDVDVSNLSIWKGLRNALRVDLENGAYFNSSLLDAVFGIAQLNLSEASIEEVTESPTIEENEITFGLPTGTTEVSEEEEESTFEEPIDFSTEDASEDELPTFKEDVAKQKADVQNKINKIKKDINLLESQRNKTSALRIRKINILGKQIQELNTELDGLIAELERLNSIGKPVVETSTEIIPEVAPSIEEKDDEGKTIVNSATPFRSMPIELQYLLAKQYYINTLYKTSVKLPNIQNLKWDKDRPEIQALQEGFDAETSLDAEGKPLATVYFEKEFTEQWRSWVENLEEEVVKAIEKKLPLNSYKDIIGEFNKGNLNVNKPIVEEEEEDFDKPKPFVWNDAAEQKLNSVRQTALNNIRIDGDGVSTTFIDHLGKEEIIRANSEPVLRNIINDTYSLQGWANNTNNIIGKTFKAKVGDQGAEIEILIEKVKILPEGDIQIIASRSDKENGKVYNMYVRLANGRILSYKQQNKSITADRLDFIRDFFGVTVVPFDPTLKTRTSQDGAGPLFQMPTSVQDIKSEFAGIDKYFSEEELKLISEELSNIKNSKEYAQYLVDIQDALNQRIEASLKKPTQQGGVTTNPFPNSQIQQVVYHVDKRKGLTEETLVDDKTMVYKSGVFFTTEKEYAEKYAEAIGGVIYEAYIDAQILVEMNKDEIQYYGRLSREFFDEFPDADAGVYMSDDATEDKYGKVGVEVVIFKPEKIKLISPTQQQTPVSAKKADLGFEEVSNQITDNWKVLSDKTFYQYTGTNVALKNKYTDKKSWTINSRDVDYIRAVHFSLFKNTKEDFLNAVLEKLYEIDSFADTVKTIDLRQPTEEVEEKVRAYLYSALQQGLAGSKVITALNKKLSASGSTKVIKYTIRSKKANTIVEIVDKSSSQLKPKINKARELTQEVRDYFMSQDDYLTDDQAMYLIYDVLRTQKLHPDILGDIVGRIGKSDLAAYKSLLSSKSNFKKADEFGDAVLDGYTIASGKSRADLVIELLSSNNKLSQMKDYFEGRYLMAKEDADQDFVSDEDLYEEWLANSGLSLANIAATDYKNSIEYKILTGQFKGDYNSLTNKQKALYDESGLYKTKEEDPFTVGLGLNATVTEHEKKVSDFYQINFLGLQAELQIAKMRDMLNDSNITFEEMVYIRQSLIFGNFSFEQKQLIVNTINRQLGAFEEFYLNKSIITVDLNSKFALEKDDIETGVYVIEPSQTQTERSLGITVRNLKTNKKSTLNPSLLLNLITKIYAPGEIITDSKVNTSTLNTEDVNEIKESITDIFRNFNSNISEFENIKNTELLNQITEEFNKCK